MTTNQGRLSAHRLIMSGPNVRVADSQLPHVVFGAVGGPLKFQVRCLRCAAVLAQSRAHSGSAMRQEQPMATVAVASVISARPSPKFQIPNAVILHGFYNFPR